MAMMGVASCMVPRQRQGFKEGGGGLGQCKGTKIQGHSTGIYGQLAYHFSKVVHPVPNKSREAKVSCKGQFLHDGTTKEMKKIPIIYRKAFLFTTGSIYTRVISPSSHLLIR